MSVYLAVHTGQSPTGMEPGSDEWIDWVIAHAEGTTPGVWKSWGMMLLADSTGSPEVADADPVVTSFQVVDGHPRTFDLEWIRVTQPTFLVPMLQELARLRAEVKGDVSATSHGRVTATQLAILDEVSHRHPRPWTVGVGSYTLAALVEEVQEYRALRAGTGPGMTENQSTETTVTETVTTTEPETVEVPVETPAKDEGTIEVDAAAVDPQQ